MKLAENLKIYTERKGITIAKLARIANVPPQTIHNWTTGRRSIDPEQVRRVAEALEVPIYELMFSIKDPFEYQGTSLLEEIFSGDVRVTLHKIELNKK